MTPLLSSNPTLPSTLHHSLSTSTPYPRPRFSASLHRSRAVVIGAGLAGLAAATHLHSSGVPFLLLEASETVGGRVRTDECDGFLLDRGFQIILTAYPEARRLLDYAALDLKPFYPGALVYFDGALHRIADPFRRPVDGLLSLVNPIGTVPDKVRIGLARVGAVIRSDYDILTAAEVPILNRLRSEGFTDSIVDRFFRPFFGGIFFDRELETTSRLFDFVFKCLALGDNALPAKGIAAIPEQLSARLPSGAIRFNSKAIAVNSNGPEVMLEGGETIRADLGVIVAVEQPEAARLLPGSVTGPVPSKPPRSTACLYFAAERAPLRDPVLVLNGSGKGVVNNMFFATNVAPSYGPPGGKTLVSVSVVGTREGTSDCGDLTAEVVEELKGWFGEEVGEWRHLRTYRIGFAQPDQSPPKELAGKDPRVGKGVYICGDHWTSATFDGALVSGRRAAEALVGDKVKPIA